MIVFLLLCVALQATLFSMRPATMSDELHWVISLAGVGCLLPMYLWTRSRERADIPFAAGVGGFYLATFILPAYSEARIYTLISDELTSDTAYLLLAGLLALGGSWWVILQVFPRPSRVEGVSPASFTSDRYFKFGIIFYAVVLTLDRQGISALLPGSLYQLFVELRTFGLVLTSLAIYRSLGTAWSWTGVGLLFLTVLFCFTSGQLAPVLRDLVTVAIALGAFSRRLAPIGLALVLGGTLFIGLQSVKSDWRATVWFGDREFTEVEKLELWRDLVSERSNSEDYTSDDILEQASGRAAAILVFEHTRLMVPEYLPYQEGRTLSPVLVSWIPRALWPDKPVAGFGNEFGRHMGLLGADNYSSVVNVPWMVDWYWNFGVAGVVMGMLLSGGILGLIDRFYNGRGLHAYDLAMGVTLIWHRLVVHESNWAMSIGRLVLLILFLGFLRSLLGVSEELKSRVGDNPNQAVGNLGLNRGSLSDA